MRRWWIWLIGPGKILAVFLITMPIIWLLNAFTTNPTFWVAVLMAFLSGALGMLVMMSSWMRVWQWKMKHQSTQNQKRQLTSDQLKNLAGHIINANEHLGLCVVISMHGEDGDTAKLGVALAGRMKDLPVLAAVETLHELANSMEQDYRKHVSAAN